MNLERLAADLLEERLAVRYGGRGNRDGLRDLHRANAAWRASR